MKVFVVLLLFCFFNSNCLGVVGRINYEISPSLYGRGVGTRTFSVRIDGTFEDIFVYFENTDIFRVGELTICVGDLIIDQIKGVVDFGDLGFRAVGFLNCYKCKEKVFKWTRLTENEESNICFYSCSNDHYMQISQDCFGVVDNIRPFEEENDCCFCIVQ